MSSATTQSKTALVLAGGGLTGAVYEIGALRAIDDLLVDRTVNDFDIYVGTSAGALVAAGLANGLSPETMLQAMEGTHAEIDPVKPQHIFNLDYVGLVRGSLNLPWRFLTAWSDYLRHIEDMTFFDLLWSLTEAMPTGFANGLALEKYLRQLLSTPGTSNSFADLASELYIIATDLDNGERVVFGRENDVPISLAVAASSALPVVYKPVHIGDHEYVDGGVRGNASLDLAIENGATLVVCINPMVPFDNTDRSLESYLKGKHLSDKGLQFISAQVTRILTHSGLHYHIKQLRRLHPDVDIVLIEPNREDFEMFFSNIMRYSARLAVARHGFESVTLELAEDYPALKSILARHEVPISRRLVITELAEIRDSGYDVEVIRKVLEARSGPCNRYDHDSEVCQLTRTLAELEMALDNLA